MNREEQIEALLQDEEYLRCYLEEMDVVDVTVPETLNVMIRKRVLRKRRRLIADIAKIAACLVLSISIANTELVINGADAQLLEITQSAEEKISDFYQAWTTPNIVRGRN